MKTKDSIFPQSLEDAIKEILASIRVLDDELQPIPENTIILRSFGKAYPFYCRQLLNELQELIDGPWDALKLFEVGRLYGQLQVITGINCRPIPDSVIIGRMQSLNRSHRKVDFTPDDKHKIKEEAERMKLKHPSWKRETLAAELMEPIRKILQKSISIPSLRRILKEQGY
jgi:hypothetical protein